MAIDGGPTIEQVNAEKHVAKVGSGDMDNLTSGGSITEPKRI